MFWRSITLKPLYDDDNDDAKDVLWKLAELKEIIEPHVSIIKSVRIWGVRDNIVKYLLSSCLNLQHLTICGWTTLSDHCLRLLPSQLLKIKTLELIGSSKDTNFVSVDAYTLSNLLVQSPHMTNLVFGCDSQVHAETFVTELEQNTSLGVDLQLFTLASRKTWLNSHILRLTYLFPDIQKIYLMPDLLEGLNIDQENLDLWIANRINKKIAIEENKHLPLIFTDDMIIYHKPEAVSAS
jgi:hypothetical protein